ncbi:MAG: 4-hydroxy-tetrahydrodipicolinate synthase [Clostridia bacterium]|nr:4-hydroxy-tetrahydrodipicolinate synthase [Clostridia bacterium]
MKKTVFTGAAVALITPFKNGKVDFDAFEKIIDFQIENKTDALVICGTTGEAATMPDAEHVATVEHAVKYVNGRVPVIAGAGSNDTEHGVNLCKEMERVGADALLLVTPYYNKCTQKGLIAHYKKMAEAVSLPCILYNVPGRTGVDIAPSTVKTLSEIENIVGIKEASGKLEAVTAIRNLCGDDFAIYSGNDDITVPIMSMGGLGVISVLSNIMPKETHDMCVAALNNDYKTASKIQVETVDLVNALFIEVNPIPVKTAAHLMGMCDIEMRMPLCEMEDKNLEVLKAEMKRHNLI